MIIINITSRYITMAELPITTAAHLIMNTVTSMTELTSTTVNITKAEMGDITVIINTTIITETNTTPRAQTIRRPMTMDMGITTITTTNGLEKTISSIPACKQLTF